MSVVDGSFGHPLKREERASAPLAGGIMLHGYQCGMLWGATLAAGAQAYHSLGPSPQAEGVAITAAQRLVESFRAQTDQEINCLEITDLNLQAENQAGSALKFLTKGGPILCLSMTARYPPKAVSAINTALSETHIKAPSPPVSCAALLARKMGVSDKHAVMAAGFAGGIGLSGGGCGALGAAIWIITMNSKDEGAEVDYQNPQALDAIDRFIKSADYEFECSEIVGRRFESIDDHARHLRDGGCSKIIETLAAQR